MSDEEEPEKLVKKVKILGISCSPRQRKAGHECSRSEKLLEKLIVYAEEFGGDVKIIKLAKLKIRPCEGCYSDSPDGSRCVFPCINKDDTNRLLSEIIDCNALVLATPIYWGGPSSLLRILIEKMTALENNAEMIFKKKGWEPLEGKPFILIASQDSEGASLALAQTTWALNHMGMLLLPYGLIFEPALLERPIVKVGLRLIGVRKFEWIDNSIRLAARNLILFTAKNKDYAFDDYLVVEPKT